MSNEQTGSSAEIAAAGDAAGAALAPFGPSSAAEAAPAGEQALEEAAGADAAPSTVNHGEAEGGTLSSVEPSGAEAAHKVTTKASEAEAAPNATADASEVVATPKGCAEDAVTDTAEAATEPPGTVRITHMAAAERFIAQRVGENHKWKHAGTFLVEKDGQAFLKGTKQYATHPVSGYDLSRRSTGSSRYLGVHWSEISQRWHAQSRDKVSLVACQLGAYLTEIGASHAYHCFSNDLPMPTTCPPKKAVSAILPGQADPEMERLLRELESVLPPGANALQSPPFGSGTRSGVSGKLITGATDRSFQSTPAQASRPSTSSSSAATAKMPAKSTDSQIPKSLAAALTKRIAADTGEMDLALMGPIDATTGLPEDAPPGHVAYTKVKYWAGSNRCVFRYDDVDQKATFQVSQVMAGSAHACQVIARACFLKFHESGWDKDTVTLFKEQCFTIAQKVQQGVPADQLFPLQSAPNADKTTKVDSAPKVEAPVALSSKMTSDEVGLAPLKVETSTSASSSSKPSIAANAQTKAASSVEVSQPKKASKEREFDENGCELRTSIRQDSACRRASTSKFKGVTLLDSQRAKGGWQARASHNGMPIHIGFFDEEIKAAIALREYYRRQEVDQSKREAKDAQPGPPRKQEDLAERARLTELAEVAARGVKFAEAAGDATKEKDRHAKHKDTPLAEAAGEATKEKDRHAKHKDKKGAKRIRKEARKEARKARKVADAGGATSHKEHHKKEKEKKASRKEAREESGSSSSSNSSGSNDGKESRKEFNAPAHRFQGMPGARHPFPVGATGFAPSFSQVSSMMVLTYRDAVRWQNLQTQLEQQKLEQQRLEHQRLEQESWAPQQLQQQALAQGVRSDQALPPQLSKPSRTVSKRATDRANGNTGEASSVAQMQQDLQDFLEADHRAKECKVDRQESEKKRKVDWALLSRIETGTYLIDLVSEEEECARQEEWKKQQVFEAAMRLEDAEKETQKRKKRALAAASFLPGPSEAQGAAQAAGNQGAATYDPYEMTEAVASTECDEEFDDGELRGALQALGPPSLAHVGEEIAGEGQAPKADEEEEESD